MEIEATAVEVGAYALCSLHWFLMCTLVFARARKAGGRHFVLPAMRGGFGTKNCDLPLKLILKLKLLCIKRTNCLGKISSRPIAPNFYWKMIPQGLPFEITLCKQFYIKDM